MQTKQMPSHDNCHCTGKGCPMKEKCVRYKLSLVKVDFPVCYFEKSPVKDGKCKYFVR